MPDNEAPVAHYDLAIIGTGSGNSVVTPDFDDWQIAIIESGTFGGTCINVGCIPTKMFVYSADVADTVRHAARYGVDAHIDGVRWTDIRDRIFGRIDPIAVGGRDYRANGPNTVLYQAEARFVGPRELVLATGQRLTADRIVLAAGSRATVPMAIAESGVAFHTSDTVMRLDRLPEHLAIIGGGYIASEFAHVFSALGSRVTLVARGERLVRHLDADISQAFTDSACRRWDVHLDTRIESIARDPSGDHLTRLVLSDGATVRADTVLVATGRTPNSDHLDPGVAGLQLTDDGRIWVDEFQRTNVDGIWALGDVSSPYQLKHVANHEARIVAHNLANPESMIATDHRYVPSAIFTHPQLASVGLTEAEAIGRGHDIAVSRQAYSGTAYGWAMEDTESFAKLIADRSTGLLLGAHILGPHASTLIQPLIQAMSFGQPVDGLARGQYWIHPALAEVVENALLGLKLH